MIIDLNKKSVEILYETYSKKDPGRLVDILQKGDLYSPVGFVSFVSLQEGCHEYNILPMGDPMLFLGLTWFAMKRQRIPGGIEKETYGYSKLEKHTVYMYSFPAPVFLYRSMHIAVRSEERYRELNFAKLGY